MVPVVEELLFRGYYQPRLAEDCGDAPAILAVAFLFTLTRAISDSKSVERHDDRQLVLYCSRAGLIFAWTRSLIPGIVAHAITNIPITRRELRLSRTRWMVFARG